MELREFASRVLFSTSLEEKLAPAAVEMTDEAPGTPVALPAAPGRPERLRIARHGERAPLPLEHELRDDGRRAVLLHFFANHELLATELMALALLRFPDAPPAFRRGLLQTLGEEQEHTRLYIQRMARAGLSFGDLPVNGFFWRHVADMQSPLDYVSRLSLTFEQANLDYARHYARVFADARDADSAALLERIYTDEIRHVGYGLRWLRKWKDPAESDWEAWRRALRRPLSAAHARGNAPFNESGRRRAGMDDAFIGELQRSASGSTRRPDVHVFNPGAELCTLTHDPAAGRRDRATTALARDLDLLPIALARAGDIILVQHPSTTKHLRALQDAGLPPVECVVLDAAGQLPADAPLRTRRVGALRPWGWSPDAAALLAPLVENARLTAAVPEGPALRYLYSKSCGAALLASLSEALPDAAALAGRTCSDLKQCEEVVHSWHDRGHSSCVLKAPWGLAGRSMRVAHEAVLTCEDRHWLAAVFHEQGAVVVEPWLDRVADFSVHYDVPDDGLPRLRGMVLLHCDGRGKFLGCTAARSVTRLLPGACARALHEAGAAALYRSVIPEKIATLVPGSGFHGWLGLDALVHRDPGGRLQLRPVVEMNPRCTMGRITLGLRRFAAPDAAVTLRIFSRKHFRAADCPSPAAFAVSLTSADPLVCDDTGLVKSGTLCLNDPETAQQFIAAAKVTPLATFHFTSEAGPVTLSQGSVRPAAGPAE